MQITRGITRGLLPLFALAIVCAALTGASRTTAAAGVGIGELTAQAFALLNAERAAAGLPAFEEVPELTAVAAERAQEMADAGYLFHASPSGVDVFALLEAHGLNCGLVSENIALGIDPASVVVGNVHAMLMADAPHRAHVLDPGYSRAGIGIALRGGVYYFVYVFTSDDC